MVADFSHSRSFLSSGGVAVQLGVHGRAVRGRAAVHVGPGLLFEEPRAVRGVHRAAVVRRAVHAADAKRVRTDRRERQVRAAVRFWRSMSNHLMQTADDIFI